MWDHSRKARTRHPKINPCRWASSDTNRKVTTISSLSVVTTANPTSTPRPQKTSSSTLLNARRHYQFDVLGYVAMPEHVHLLVSEPPVAPLSKALQALKISVSRRLTERPFWQTRYYDFNVITHNKRVEKLKYMHRNPVTRGLVSRPEDWPLVILSPLSPERTNPVLITQA
ncbi:REP element-mobilizing transposase RayT [Edaphobacter aggregans]|uniref:REP element-mobilizing transposase RayT n=2 Tax=Edaphobacter aggregans TaxID=570835 RepID=A0A428MQU3_9BACT|nr:REP element-mobilizing transposase RayT [Edaphobacter aggregans]